MNQETGNGPSASPVCYLSEVTDAYAGYLSRAEVIDVLDVLIGGLDAQARAVTEGADPDRLRQIRTRLAETVRAALPRIRDDGLHALLKGMLAADAPR